MKLSLQDDQSAYKLGNYELDSSGGLELKRFGIKLVRSMK
nr:G5P family DNA-binding protein [Vibrio fortis]